MKDILREIYRMRERRGWTERELAERADVPQSTISTWYIRNQLPTIPTLEKICQGFGISLSQFFAEGDDPVDLTTEQREMLDNWSALSENQQKIVLDLLKNM